MSTLSGLKVAILVADGFEQVEMTEPRKALQDAGAETRIVSPAKNEVQGWNHFDKADKFKVDVGLNDVDAIRRAAAARRGRQPRPAAHAATGR
jgi:protease I